MDSPPPAQYTTTSDDVQIAYATCGAGQPLIYFSGWWNHAERRWEIAETNRFWSALAEHWHFTLMDVRNTGLSQRGVEAFDPEALARDSAAVIEATTSGTVSVFSMGPSDVVKQMVTGKDFDFEDRGLVELKGFDEPVRAWAVLWE